MEIGNAVRGIPREDKAADAVVILFELLQESRCEEERVAIEPDGCQEGNDDPERLQR